MLIANYPAMSSSYYAHNQHVMKHGTDSHAFINGLDQGGP